MFRTYRFEHPTTEQSVTIHRSSYLAAGFFGPFYVLYWRVPGFFTSLVIFLALTLAIVAVSGVTSFFLPPRTQLLVLVVAVPVALAIQSIMVIDLVKKSFRRRGWIIRAP